MNVSEKLLSYAQPSIYRAAIFSRARNTNSVEINNRKEQIVTLQFQIDDKERQTKAIRFEIRTAKRANNFGAIRDFETLYRRENALLKTLRNNRNRIRNKLTGKSELQQRKFEISRKIARLREMRLAQEQHSAT